MNVNDNFPDLKAANPVEMIPQEDPIIPEGPTEYRRISKIGVTRASHEESKKRRKMAKQSRKINRSK